MNRKHWTITIALAVTMPLTLVACDGRSSGTPSEADHHDGDGHSHSESIDAGTMDSDRVAIPATVRANLGISFVRAERRRVEHTLRVPGRFEYLPTARREYRTAVPGRVELLVEQFDRVEAGQALYLLDSPAWREMQQQLADAEAQLDRLGARIEAFEPLFAAHQEHEESLHKSVAVWEERVERLQSVREAGGGRVDELAQAQASLAGTRAELANVMEKKAELRADRQQAGADLRAARSRLSYLLDAASSIISVSRDELGAKIDTPHGPESRWAGVTMIEVPATETGIVETLGLTNGSWADERTPVLTIVQPDRLRFRASGLQSDLGVLRDGLTARVVPPTPTITGRAAPMTQGMEGTVFLGLAGDPNDRTLELFVLPAELQPWARPGVSAQLEIVTDETAAPELAIPLAAVQRDGLAPVIFRRNPDNPDEVVRIEAGLGLDDGRWVAVLNGLHDGDEVVLDGAFQLMLATSGAIQKGGHFHSDGTFHEGED